MILAHVVYMELEFVKRGLYIHIKEAKIENKQKKTPATER